MSRTVIRAGHGMSGLAAGLAVLLLVLAAPAQTMGADVNTVKAALVFKLAAFIEWPEERHEYSANAFELAVLGARPLEGAFDVLHGKTFRNMPFHVVRFDHWSRIEDSRIVFVDESVGQPLGEITSGLARKGMLLVSDRRGFAESGGMIELYIESGRVRFRINMEACNRAGLKISSKLLKLATLVEEVGTGP